MAGWTGYYAKNIVQTDPGTFTPSTPSPPTYTFDIYTKDERLFLEGASITMYGSDPEIFDKIQKYIINEYKRRAMEKGVVII